METYDQLKKKIQELCPEIMELKFGCEVLFKTPNCKDIYKGKILKNDEYIWLWNNFMPNDVFFQTKRYFKRYGKIIGSPITLAVVLRAVGKSDWYISTNNGRFFKWSRNLGEMIGQDIYWDLTKDNLDDQPDNVKQFLSEILL